jgi:hypothetical protein
VWPQETWVHTLSREAVWRQGWSDVGSQIRTQFLRDHHQVSLSAAIREPGEHVPALALPGGKKEDGGAGHAASPVQVISLQCGVVGVEVGCQYSIGDTDEEGSAQRHRLLDTDSASDLLVRSEQGRAGAWSGHQPR